MSIQHGKRNEKVASSYKKYRTCIVPYCRMKLNYHCFQASYVVCGSSDSEVTVWDVNNLAAPVVPLKKLALGADVSCVEFNR